MTAPRTPDDWYNLGLALRRERRYDEALAAYQRALDLHCTGPEEVHLNRGVIYADDLRRPAEAERELDAALALNPVYAPAWLNLGNLHEDLGRREAARAAYERLLQLQPGNPEALARLAGVATRESAAPLALQLRVALAQPFHGAWEQARLGFALGRLLDGAGEYPAAFAAYAEANRAARACLPREARYDRARHTAMVDALVAAFTPDRVAALRTASTARPVFICGMFRSGSTLVEQVLASHPSVVSGGETDALGAALAAVLRTDAAGLPATLARVTSADLERTGAHYLASLAQLARGAQVVTDKRLDNFLLIGLVKCLFPQARIVHTVRHPLDTGLSMFFQHIDHGAPYACDLGDIGHYFREYRRLMAHWETLFGGELLHFDYDRFVQAPREATAALLEYCGLTWDERCLQFHTAAAPVRTASVWQVREPLFQRSSGRWQHYEQELAPLRAALAAFLP